jgi:aromatic ring-opening dioxygenase catalytic subunit (LigB family)
VIAAATVHAPYITGWPERAEAGHREQTMAGFATLGRAFRAAGVATLVVVSSEHIVNLQPRLAPAFVIGVADRYKRFPEPHFKLPPGSIRGDAVLADELVNGLYRNGFEPAHSSELVLDHGTTLPLELMNLTNDISIVPLIINSLFPPLPTLQRCRELGAQLAALLDGSNSSRSVGLLATGGLSHSVGTPGVDRVDRDFDERFIRMMLEGDLEALARISDAELNVAGNGTHEVRNWIAVAAAAHRQRPAVVTGIPYAPGWNTGIHQMLWSPA